MHALARSGGSMLAKSARAGVQPALPMLTPKAPAVASSVRSGLAPMVRPAAAAVQPAVPKDPAVVAKICRAAVRKVVATAAGVARGTSMEMSTTSKFKALAAAASRPSCLASKAGLSYTANAAGAGQVTASHISFPARGFFTKASSGSGNTGRSSKGRCKYRRVLFVGGLNGGAILIVIGSPLQKLPGPEELISDTSPLENGEDDLPVIIPISISDTSPLENGEDGFPVNFDWSSYGCVPPVVPAYYQLFCGSCWAIVAVQSGMAINIIVNGDFTQLSVQQVLDCVNRNGCAGGFPSEAFAYMTQVGLTRQDVYPFSFLRRRCKAEDKPIVFRLNGMSAVPPNEEAFKKALLLSPFPVAVYANKRFRQFEGDSILDIDECPPSPDGIGNHSVLLVGFGVDKKGNKFWRVQNSWGVGWGDKGFAKIRRGGPNKDGAAGITANLTVRPLLDKRSD